MRILNENVLEENGLRIEFAGWTNSKNTNYRELADEIHDNQIEKKGEIIPISVPKQGKEEYIKILRRTNLLVSLLIANRLFVKGIKFDGSYHQEGKYGCPLFKVNDLGVLKWSCSSRYWGEIMSSAGYGFAYDEWAWQSPEEPVTPDMVEKKALLIE